MADDIPEFPGPPLTIAISACLTGEEVRYDGGHKRSAYPHELLSPLFSLRPVCPEVGIGLGVPRNPIQLVGEIESPRARGVKDPNLDVTDALETYAETTSRTLTDVDGYVFMKGSPSCGLFRVKVYGREATPRYEGRGIYASAIERALPLVPLEESGRLNDKVLRENFVNRVFAHAHIRRLRECGITAGRLVAFHSRYKYLVMAHSVPAYIGLGRLLSDLKGDVLAIAETYFHGLLDALKKPATRGGHANALMHLQGYVKNAIPSQSRQELAELIESFRVGEVPLLAPLTLLKHHLQAHEATYALNQLYLEPHPPLAALRREI